MILGLTASGSFAQTGAPLSELGPAGGVRRHGVLRWRRRACHEDRSDSAAASCPVRGAVGAAPALPQPLPRLLMPALAAAAHAAATIATNGHAWLNLLGDQCKLIAPRSKTNRLFDPDCHPWLKCEGITVQGCFDAGISGRDGSSRRWLQRTGWICRSRRRAATEPNRHGHSKGRSSRRRMLLEHRVHDRNAGGHRLPLPALARLGCLRTMATRGSITTIASSTAWRFRRPTWNSPRPSGTSKSVTGTRCWATKWSIPQRQLLLYAQLHLLVRLPFTHTGVLGTYTKSDYVTYNFGVEQGWDNFDDTDHGVGVIGGVTVKSCDKKTTLAYFFEDSREPSQRASRVPTPTGSRNSIVLTKNLTDRTTLVLENADGFQTDGNGRRRRLRPGSASPNS